jgi:hypothetical protein
LGKRIGDVLISDGLLSEKTLSRALELQAGTARGTKLGAILLKWDLVAERDLLRTLSKMHHCPAADWATLSCADKSVTGLLSGAQASRLGALPYAIDGKRLRVAFTNPSNIAAVDEVQAITGRRVLPSVTSDVRMNQAHQRFYSRPLSREMWSVVQKIESRDASLRTPARPIPPPPPALTTASPAPPPETACSDVWLGESGGTESVEPVESLIPLEGENVPVESGREALSAPDPLADDGPLSNFLEGVIHYYGSTSDLHEALAAIEMGPIEDLDASMFVEEQKPSGDRIADDPMDETHPSRRSRRPSHLAGLL